MKLNKIFSVEKYICKLITSVFSLKNIKKLKFQTQLFDNCEARAIFI